jgi:hypothetical protein
MDPLIAEFIAALARAAARREIRKAAAIRVLETIGANENGSMFLHFSSSALVQIKDRRQSPLRMADAGGGKPNGLWFTVGAAAAAKWSTIADEATLQYRTTLDLDISRFLVLTNADQILAFANQHDAGLSPHKRGRIHWHSVASAFDGIIVAPFCDDDRVLQRTSWYHEWDCASGCVWKTRAVSSFSCERVGSP